ncbi:hypothetical protein B0A48_06446 [Cryoendolithus antarcticus]|uniref:Uncharacterized protein n=1 Tax=Cryoendolithus antarcticus TaxID=1507870 RepID=A0A1V8TB12_9PEZI|nr:hypothetical protein B0A48_06446 [Cryoendolithus antarcticus]
MFSLAEGGEGSPSVSDLYQDEVAAETVPVVHEVTWEEYELQHRYDGVETAIEAVEITTGEEAAGQLVQQADQEERWTMLPVQHAYAENAETTGGAQGTVDIVIPLAEVQEGGAAEIEDLPAEGGALETADDGGVTNTMYDDDDATGW